MFPEYCGTIKLLICVINFYECYIQVYDIIWHSLYPFICFLLFLFLKKITILKVIHSTFSSLFLLSSFLSLSLFLFSFGWVQDPIIYPRLEVDFCPPSPFPLLVCRHRLPYLTAKPISIYQGIVFKFLSCIAHLKPSSPLLTTPPL